MNGKVETRKLRDAGLVVALLVFLALMLATAPVAQAANTARVEFIATEPDSKGLFTVTMTIYDATFDTFQFALRYDTAKVTPANQSSGEADTVFNHCVTPNIATNGNWFISTQTSIDSSAGFIEFIGYLNSKKALAIGSDKEAGVAKVDSTGILVYTFHFKQLASGDCGLALADKSTGAFRDYLPAGGGLWRAGYALAAEFSVRLPDSLGKTVSVTEEKTPTTEEQVNESGGLPQVVAQTITKGAAGGGVVGSAATVSTRLNDTVILQIGNYSAAVNGKLVDIYPGETNVTPYIENSRTYVPIRFIAENMGATVDWDNATKTVTITQGVVSVKMTIGSTAYSVSGSAKTMEVAPEIRFSRTMVPIRFVAEALGRNVEWEPNSKLVLIAPATQPWNLSGTEDQQAISDVLTMLTVGRMFSQ